MKYFIAFLIVVAAMLLPVIASSATIAEADRYIPRAAYSYNSYLIREARFQMGMEAPIAVFAAQIHQESAWNPRAKSPYAAGLTQFTPDTEKWIIQLIPSLGTQGVWDPHWAIRALIAYDKRLLGQITADTTCDDWAMVLSAYNGGLGWLLRDKTYAQQKGKSRNLWWGHVETHPDPRRASQFIHENRDYPLKILKRHQQYYLVTGRWGTTKVCLTDI